MSIIEPDLHHDEVDKEMPHCGGEGGQFRSMLHASPEVQRVCELLEDQGCDCGIEGHSF